MLKATAVGPTGPLVFFGLSRKNCEKLLEGYPIDIDGKPLGLSHRVVIFAGESEESMTEQMLQFVGPETKVMIDPKLKG